MTAEEIDVCKTIAESASKGMRSKRMLRILSNLQDKGLIEYDPFSSSANLTPLGIEVMRAHEAAP